jgi:hypothetical protein
MNKEQHGTSIIGVAEAIARRITSIRNLAAEKGKLPPAGEAARQFSLMCERALLHSGPPSTRHMALLASELVPEAIVRLCKIDQQKENRLALVLYRGDMARRQVTSSRTNFRYG